MSTRMLIDARHQEETRVAVLKGNRIEEFDFESADKKQIKGNIYLAKVTRVEPSLQAAFVDFGGNRHGFLAFSEIHPDYYQIPTEDRIALLAAEAEAAEEEQRLRAEEEERGELPGDEYDADDESAESLVEDLAEDGLVEVDTSDKDDVSTIEEGHLDNEDDESDTEDGDQSDNRKFRGRGRRQGKNRSRGKEVDEARAKRMALRRKYKIQDVIQHRQVLLVQVVKEERGNKGAALTTYLSLAGRYTVLMPNSSHGGGISRKINSANDRKRLKQIVGDLSLPKTMGLIVRTAGLSRTKTEIKRDFDYLARLWDKIREKTLASAAPALIHSDSDLIKRAIRDIYNRDIEEVVVEGEEGYKSAKAFMKMLMPSHARKVKQYIDPVPLFQRYGAEDQLKAMYDPVVQLKSGGYLVINPTEALVSIDINSGRSTKEHNIEQTALSTNLEAAKEIARQLRLRDMAGLVVIDFIDQEHHSNTRKVERALKDALKSDRARIQVGRISSFGLMEMSRQRLRTGVLEATTRECPHCDGTGLVRTASSAGLSALRLIEEEAAKGKGTRIRLAASTEAAVYILNEKRTDLMEIETRYNVAIEVLPEGEDEGAKMSVFSHGPKPKDAPKFDTIISDEDDDLEDIVEDTDEDGENDRSRKKRRRRRGGRGRNRDHDQSEAQEDDQENDSAEAGDEEEADNSEDMPNKRRRRGGRRRGGRGRGGKSGEAAPEDSGQPEQTDEDTSASSDPDDSSQPAAEVSTDNPRKRAPRQKKGAEGEGSNNDVAEDKPKRSRRKKTDSSETESQKVETETETKPKRVRRQKTDTATKGTAPKSGTEGEDEKPRASRRKKAEPKAESESSKQSKPAAKPKKDAPITEPATPETAPSESENTQDKNEKPKRGWWQRTFGE